MKRYKPEHLSKVMPNEPPRLKGFLQDNFEQFGEVYDVCKDSSEGISDVSNVSSEDSDSLSVKVSTIDKETLQEITKRVTESSSEGLSIDKDVITSKKKKNA